MKPALVQTGMGTAGAHPWSSQPTGRWCLDGSEDSQENYGILVPSLTSQGSCHPSPQRAFTPWLLPFSVAVWGGILSKCFLVN